MKKKSNNEKTQLGTAKKFLIFAISIIIAAALVVTGILCFDPSRRSPSEGVGGGTGEESAATTRDLATEILNGTVDSGDVINFPFCATLNSRPSGTNAWWKERQNGYVVNSGVYTLKLPAGTYKFELWGGQGGNSQSNIATTYGGGQKVLSGYSFLAYGG
ncbi:MAG: hypothetical protein HFJ22_02750, partial [Clostridia bacterium]|nr:hypothetical protein [Clostridia bacterium]